MPGLDPRPDSPISLGLSQPAPPPQELPLPSVDELQFRRAQPGGEAPAAKACEACKQPIESEYYQVQNHVLCRHCAAKIREGQLNAKRVPMLRPVIYGVGAALAGCLLNALVLAWGMQIGIVALAVGWMVGKAVRHASHGIGGRPQQILAVTLTYFAISMSVVPAVIFIMVKHRGDLNHAIEARRPATTLPAQPVPAVRPLGPKVSVGKLAVGLLTMSAVSPFLRLAKSPASGLISLFILFIGLQRAWALTARQEIIVTGPYS
jgi:hypothetical protein